MEIFAGLSVALLILVALFIAIKTFGLWLRTRRLPELLLACMLTMATVIGYPLNIASTRVPVGEMMWVHISAAAVVLLGFVCLLFFTLTVFRAGVAWAAGLVGFTVLMMLVCNGWYLSQLMSDHPTRASENSITTVLFTLPIAITYLWTALESLAYHRMLKKRLAIGLGDPVVADRFMLWSLMCLSALSAALVNCVANFFGQFLSAPVVLVCSLLGLVHAICMFTAFHPPVWYKARVERRYAAASA